MFLRVIKLAEYIFDAGRVAIRIYIDISPRHMEQGYHLLHVVRDFQGVNVTWRLESETTLCRPPRVLEVMPAATEDKRMYWAGMTMTRQYARLEYVSKFLTSFGD